MRLGLGHGLDVGYRSELFGNLSLLQQYPGAAAAYTLRNIDGNNATNVVRVRRSSDDAEADFTAAEVSDGTLTTWTGANDGHVVTWYDQSGNGKNFTQATAANQPKLVNAGSLITLNSLPAIEADGTDDFMQTAAGVFGTVTDLYAFTVGAFTQTGQANDTFWAVSDGVFGSGNNWFSFRQRTNLNNFTETHGTGSEEANNGTATTAQKLFTGIFDGGVGITLGVNGSDATESATIGASVSPTQELDLFAADNSGAPVAHGAAKAQELIIYASDKSADRAAIEAAINSHYSIY